MIDLFFLYNKGKQIIYINKFNSMRLFLTFTPILLAASWAIYNVFFLIKKSIPST